MKNEDIKMNIKRINRLLDVVKKELQEALKTKITLSIPHSDMRYGLQNIEIQLPRPCGCCYVTLNEPLTMETSNLKRVVKKMREVEKIIVELDDSYECMYQIYIDLNAKDFLKESINVIVQDILN